MARIKGTKVKAEAVSVNSHTADIPAHVAGDLIIVGVIKYDTGGGAFGKTAGWTTGDEQTTYCRMAWFWRLATSSSETLTVTSGTSEYIYSIAFVYEGVDQTTPIDINHYSTQTSGLMVTGSGMTTTVNNCALWFFVGTPGSAAFQVMPEAGYTGLGTAPVSVYLSASVATGYKADAGAITAARFCWNGSNQTINGMKFAVAIRSAASGKKPLHQSHGVTLAELQELIGPNNNARINWGSPAVSSINGKTVTADTSDGYTGGGANPYHLGQRITPPVGANYYGAEGLSGSSIDCSGPMMLSMRYLTGVDLVYTGDVSQGGTVIYFRNASASNYKAWMVAAKNSATATPEDRNIFVIHPAQSVSTTIGAGGALDPAAVRAIGFVSSSPGGGCNLILSQLIKLNKIQLAGGTATNPGNFNEFLSFAGGYALPFVKRTSSLSGTAYMPIQIGGGDPVHIDWNGFALIFPAVYNQSAGRLNFHVDEGWAGLKIDARSGDSCKMRNGIISSESSYHFEVLATASASATYNFSGLTVSGASPVTLRDVTTFTGMTFDNCGKIDASGCDLTNCSVTNPKSGTAMLITTTTSLTSVAFSTATATDKALEIAAAGTYNFSGVTFTGFTTDINVTATTGTVTINVTGGDTPTYTSAGATVNIVSGATLTLTGLVTGSDIVILDAGTSTERVNVDAHGSTSYGYTYTTGGSIDIGVFKVGYVPYYIRNYSLTGTDSSVPVAQVADRNYLNPA